MICRHCGRQHGSDDPGHSIEDLEKIIDGNKRHLTNFIAKWDYIMRETPSNNMVFHCGTIKRMLHDLFPPNSPDQPAGALPAGQAE